MYRGHGFLPRIHTRNAARRAPWLRSPGGASPWLHRHRGLHAPARVSWIAPRGGLSRPPPPARSLHEAPCARAPSVTVRWVFDLLDLPLGRSRFSVEA